MPGPNIVFVMSDDHAAHAISAYGSKVNSTPHLDGLARDGVRMDATYCTNSICSPSRASILTGTYSHVNGVASIYTEIDYRVPTSQGRSFLPLLRGTEVPDWPSAIYYRYWEHDDPSHHAPAHYGVRTKEFKLIHYYGAGLGVPGSSERIFDSEWELYDLRADPEELVNVANDPAYAETRAALTEQLAELQRHYADTPYAGPSTPHPVWPWS
ncbi:sulfatase/phosphatase domain-containing protein [Kribbella sp. NPDC026596]|uniref:sulfatase/phosphatase domain-containing protein n=1 Tax=Kribbella sp. NPDC026596 TaxID=3155122 RepID=UPI0033DCAA55